MPRQRVGRVSACARAGVTARTSLAGSSRTRVTTIDILYQLSNIQSIGGTGGAAEDSLHDYFIENPWGGVPAEIQLIQVAADGAGTGWFIIGQEAITPTQINNEWRGAWFPFAAAGVVPISMDFSPCEGKVIWNVTGTSHVVLLYQWRRAVPAPDAYLAPNRALDATYSLGRDAKAVSRERTVWGADTWANIREGTAQGPIDWRRHPGSQGSRDAALLAQEGSEHLTREELRSVSPLKPGTGGTRNGLVQASRQQIRLLRSGRYGRK